ncbi:uncharacterized protein TNCV_3247691 [Trichonephila clavipes]|nr:uncharacterized protein TNCV_3247691 [Trichonephila clavipes]
MLVVDKITDLTPVKNLNVKGLIPENINLADDSFYVPGHIDCLLGGEIFYELLRSGQIRSENSNLIFKNTVFGFVASGSNSFADTEIRVHCGLIKGDLNQTLKMFWELKKDKSRDIALKRLNALWTRLIRDPQYLKLYRDFIHEYDQLGHMKEVAAENDNSDITYYMPHHGIFRPEKSKTKLRVVFNATNPTTDVKMMHRMILIHESQQPLLRILWKESPEDPVKTFEKNSRIWHGLLSPVVERAKIFMQSLWSLKIDGIDELPSERAKEWHRFLEDFKSVSSICIGKCIVHPQATRVELYGFADASEKCYGAVIYCRSQSPDGATTVKLVTSKSRVAPVKSVTMPRLELCATVLLAKLVKRVETALQMKTPPVYLWSDSTIVLAWTQNEPNLCVCVLKTFVANRVATIQHLINADQWHHVSSTQNPADLVSRGLDPFSLHNSLLWNGSTFLATKDFPERNILSSERESD